MFLIFARAVLFLYVPALLAWEPFLLFLSILVFSLLKLVNILKFRRRRNMKGITPKNIELQLDNFQIQQDEKYLLNLP